MVDDCHQATVVSGCPSVSRQYMLPVYSGQRLTCSACPASDKCWSGTLPSGGNCEADL